MTVCHCSLTGTKACETCTNRAQTPVEIHLGSTDEKMHDDSGVRRMLYRSSENIARILEQNRILREALERIEAREVARLESLLMVVAELQDIARDALLRAGRGNEPPKPDPALDDGVQWGTDGDYDDEPAGKGECEHIWIKEGGLPSKCKKCGESLLPAPKPEEYDRERSYLDDAPKPEVRSCITCAIKLAHRYDGCIGKNCPCHICNDYDQWRLRVPSGIG